jgi:serine protease Do
MLYIAVSSEEFSDFDAGKTYHWIHPSQKRAQNHSKLITLVVIFSVGSAIFVGFGLSAYSSHQNVSAPVTSATAVMISPDLISYVKHLEPALVGVDIKSGNKWYDGTGIVVRKDGLIATSYYLTKNASEINIHDLFGHIWKGDLIGFDLETDIALIRVKKVFPDVASFATAQENQAGELAIGLCLVAPSSQIKIYLTRINEADLRAVLNSESKILSVDTTDELNSPCGDSAVLVDSVGHILGIKVLQDSYQNSDIYESSILLPYAINSILNRVQVHAWLGIQGQNIEMDSDLDVGNLKSVEISLPVVQGIDHGVYVQKVYPNSPAELAGIRSGDVITSLDGVPIENMNDLQSTLYRLSPGNETEVVIYRNGSYIKIPVQLGNGGT